MDNIIAEKIVGALTALVMVLSSFVAQQPAINQTVPTLGGPSVGADAFNFVAGTKYRLSGSGVSSTDTSVGMQSFTQPNSGLELTMADFGGVVGYLTLEPGTSRQEFVSFSGVTQSSSNSSATLTGVTRGLGFVFPYTASTTLRLSHAGGSIASLSNPPQLYNQLGAKGNNETVTGLWTFSTSPYGSTATSSNQLVTLGQVNGIAVQGAATSTETNGGIVELGTLAEQASSFNGGAAQPTVLQTKNSTSTCQVVGSYNIVASTTTGKLDKNCFDATLSYSFTGSNSMASTTHTGIFTNQGTTTLSAGTTTPIVANGVKYTFPSSDGIDGERLTTNGNGSLRWDTASSTGFVSQFAGGQVGVTTDNFNDNTSANCGKFIAPQRITVNRMSIFADLNAAAQSVKIGIYSETGGKKLFEATTMSTSTRGLLFATVTPSQNLLSGMYYGCVMVASGTANLTVSTWDGSQVVGGIRYLNNGTTTTQVMSGHIVGLGANTFPASFNPATVFTPSGNVPGTEAPIIRFDN